MSEQRYEIWSWPIGGDWRPSGLPDTDSLIDACESAMFLAYRTDPIPAAVVEAGGEIGQAVATYGPEKPSYGDYPE
jgi:hypothetical protein